MHSNINIECGRSRQSDSESSLEAPAESNVSSKTYERAKQHWRSKRQRGGAERSEAMPVRERSSIGEASVRAAAQSEAALEKPSSERRRRAKQHLRSEAALEKQAMQKRSGLADSCVKTPKRCRNETFKQTVA